MPRSGEPDSVQQSVFEVPKSFGAANVSSRAVAVADFDADGHIDWVMARIGQQNIVCLGDGNGGVKREILVGTDDGRTYCVAVADLNNDRRPDIVAGNVGQANAVLFDTGGDSGFVLQSFGLADSVTYGLCLGDVTGDGFIDVVVANSGQPNRIYVNQPKRTARK